MRRLLIATFGLLVLAGIGYAAFHYRYAATPHPEAPAAYPANATVSMALTDPYVEHDALYDLSAAYPTTTPLTGAANDAAVESMQSWVIGRVGSFKDAVEAASTTSAHATLAITYTLTAAADRLSYLFTVIEHLGQAEATTSTHTFTFDASSGTPLTP